MTFQVNHDKEWVEVFLVINHDKLSLLNENMKSEFKSSEDLKRENLHMSFDITNNGRENYSLNAEGVYLNGKPNSIGFTERVPFDRTKSNKISLSNLITIEPQPVLITELASRACEYNLSITDPPSFPNQIFG